MRQRLDRLRHGVHTTGPDTNEDTSRVREHRKRERNLRESVLFAPWWILLFALSFWSVRESWSSGDKAPSGELHWAYGIMGEPLLAAVMLMVFGLQLVYLRPTG